MYVVFAEESDSGPPKPRHSAETLEQAFARIACHRGLSYRFESAGEYGWDLFLTDVERLECSPAPIRSRYKGPQDAHHDLMSQAVDGRIRGHVAVPSDAFAELLIMKTDLGVRARVA